MKIDYRPLMDAIDKYIAKADDDLENTLASEGYVNAAAAVKAINSMEDAVSEALEDDADKFLEKIQESTGVEIFIEDFWPDIKNSEDLKNELREIFRKQFDDLMHQFTYDWILSDVPDVITVPTDGRITKPAEAFIRGWSGELADLMHLSTKDTMEHILLKAQEKGWTIDEVSEAISNSGIRQCGYRSRRVAVTEVLRVESYSQQEGMVQNPLCYKKRWRHVDNAHPRENHVAIDGQEVYKREFFTLGQYRPLCPRDTSLPASETVNCHCIMETIANENALGMTGDEWTQMRNQYMDEVDAEYEAWEKKYRKEQGIEKPRDDPSVTWEVYNSYYEAYRRGEIA